MKSLIKTNGRIGWLLFFIFGFSLFMSCTGYKADQKGVSVFIKSEVDNSSQALRVDVISDDIIRVQIKPEKPLAEKKSLIVQDEVFGKTVDWNHTEKDGFVIVSTANLDVKINKETGKVAFYDKQGNLKLQDADSSATIFTPVIIEGEDFYEIQKVFNSPDDEAFYGLGQHQHGQVNYKGEDVDLYQHNLIAVVPFLISNKNYGILWDNYSRTKFGDPREYQPLSIFKLYNENAKEGGLTARYYNSTKKENVFLERQEDKIQYEFLDDLKTLPEGFDFENGVIEWKGFIESKDAEGLYKFLPYSSGYLKVWINDEKRIDSWRQGWNPWSRKFKIDLKPGTKVKIAIEWIPDSKESFFAFECLTPYNPVKQQQLSLYSEVAAKIDYYFINGTNADELISGYRTLTGKAPIMPKWAMGLWQSRERYKTQKELLDVVKEYRKRQIPLDNIVLDWHYWPTDKWGDHGFDSERFPDPKGMVDELHKDLHARIMISVWAKYYENTENYKRMNEKGWIYPQNIQNRQKDWVGPGYVSSFYDAFNEGARKEYWRQLSDSLFSKGFDAWWLDATEPDIRSNISLDERKKLMAPVALGKSAEYLNAYSVIHSKGVYEGQRKEKPNQRVFILTRSAFAGQQKYAAATWSGDVVSRWSDLKDQIAAGVNMGASGIPFWTTDIGGFSIEKRYEKPNSKDLEEWRELNLRWFQFGAFCPLFRIHGQFPFREIYNTSPVGHPVYNSMVYYDKLRYRLMPYIYSLAGMAYHEDYTLMRPLFMDHSEDSQVLNVNDEFMFGSNLLVCPVHNFKERSRKVYFPNTSGWFDLLSGKYFEGGQEIRADAPLEKIPVYVPEGTILPMGPVVQYINEKLTDPVAIYIFGGKDGEFTLYEDEGTNYDYEKGSFCMIKFSYNEKEKTLIIGEPEGHFPGMLKERTFVVKYISKDTGEGIESEKLPDRKIVYIGKSIKLNL